MSVPIRVAHVVGKMKGGGVESVVMNYFRHIDRSKVQFDFLVDADSTLVPRGEIESLGGRVFEVPPYQHVLAYQRELQCLFKQERWQIVHSHINALSVLPLRVAKKEGVPIRIAHSHSTSAKDERLKNALKAILKSQANRYPTHRYACSKDAGKWLFGAETAFDVIPNAIELERFTFSSEKRNAVRKQLGLNDRDFVIGHIGRFVKQKNQKFLLEAFSCASAARDNLRLVLVGEGQSRNDCEEWCAKHNLAEKILFLGQRNDVDALYCAFDLFALPSLYEGLGMVAVEAQACGLICIASPNIPSEANIANHLGFKQIDSVSEWADCFVSARVRRDRSVDLASFSLYDIGYAANALCSRYESLLLELRG